MKNDVLFGADALSALKRGVDVVHQAVSKTLGASGSNVVYRRYGSPLITNDGISIADEIHLRDEAESMGADLIKQAAQKTNDEAGDGTSTAVELTHAMITEGMTKIKAGKNPMKLKKEMEVAFEKVSKEIVPIPVKSDEDLFNVANISVENPEIAKLVSEAVKTVGIDGLVTVEESSGFTIEKEQFEGLTFDHGFISPYMVTNPAKMEAVLNDVYVLVSDKKFMSMKDVFPLLEELAGRGVRQLFIICESMEGEILATVIANRLKGTFHIVAVKKPFNKEMLEDIAVLTGGKSITEEKGIRELSSSHYEWLGKAKKVVVGRESCSIIGGAGEKEKLDERIESIKEALKGAEGYEKDKLKERLAKLSGGYINIKVGAPTEAEMKYLKLKVDDAVNATRAAMEEGIVIGGGRTLYDVSLGKAESDGEDVIRKACGMPMRRIIENSGEDAEAILAVLGKGEVWNALINEKSSDPYKDGIIDPAKVERCALKNATSLSAIFLTSHAAIVEQPVDSVDKPRIVV
jgi:chaperonin GroEL